MGCSSGAATSDFGPAPAEPGRAAAEGIEAQLPGGWRAVRPHQPSQITDPVARLALASGPVVRAPKGCHVGAYDIPAAGAMVVVLEWNDAEYEPRSGLLAPARVGAEDLPLYDPGIECFAGRGGAVSLRDNGRVFSAYVMLGRRAGPRTRDEALSVVRSLRAAPLRERPPGIFDATTDVAIAGGGVWLSSIATRPTPDGGGSRAVHRLERFDPVTLERTAGPIRLEAAWRLATGPRRLWAIGRKRLEVVDPVAGRVVGRVSGLGWSASALAIGPGRGWAIESRPNRLLRIDTPRGRLAGPWRRAGRQAMLALALDERSLWVTSLGPRLPQRGVSPAPRGRGTLARLDARTGAVEGRLRVGRGPGAVALGFGSVWVMNADDGTLARIDPARLRSTATIRLSEAGGNAAGMVDLAVGPDRIWVADPTRGGSSLRAVDPARDRVVIEPSVSTGRAVAVAVAAGPEGTFVALSGGARGRLCRVEEATGTLGPCAR